MDGWMDGWKQPDSQVNKLEITPDKAYIAAAGNPHVRLFELNSNSQNPVTSFDGHTTNVTSLGFQRESRWMYTSSEDGTVKIWDIRAPGAQRDYDNRKVAINSAVLHPNQGEVIFGDQNGKVKVWDLTSDRITQEITPEADVGIRSVAISSDASLVTAGNSTGNVYVWKLDAASKFEPINKIQAHSDYVLTVKISPDVKYICTTSADHKCKIWLTENFSEDKVLVGHQRWVWDAVWSADSAYIITASSDHVSRLWDISTSETVRHYTGHHKAVTALALNDV
jgi:target of rapamycin complex subunit LST8